MPTDIVQTMNHAVFASDDDERVRIHCQPEEIARVREFARMPGKKPITPPDLLKIQTINLGIRIKTTGQRPSRVILRRQ